MRPLERISLPVMILPQTRKRLPNEMISAAQATVRAAAPFEEIFDAM
jgi:hypothetical protein